MHVAPTVVFATTALLAMLISLVYLERMKKQHDLVTYREVLAFSRGERVERDTLAGHREREMKPWMRGIRIGLQVIFGALVGGAVGIGIGMLIKTLS